MNSLQSQFVILEICGTLKCEMNCEMMLRRKIIHQLKQFSAFNDHQSKQTLLRIEKCKIKQMFECPITVKKVVNKQSRIM